MSPERDGVVIVHAGGGQPVAIAAARVEPRASAQFGAVDELEAGGPAPESLDAFDSIALRPYQLPSEVAERQPPAGRESFQDLGPVHLPEMEIPLDPEVRMKAFNETTGTILAQAYQSFPEMASVQPVIHGPKAGVNQDFYRSNLKWLEEEGYIRFSRVGKDIGAPQLDHYQFTLTSKGLGVLTTKPHALADKGESIGSAMVGAVKKGAKDSLQDLAKEALKHGLEIAGRVAMNRIGL